MWQEKHPCLSASAGSFSLRFLFYSILLIYNMYIANYFKKISFLERIAYTMIFSGAVGNMIDRIFRAYVVDMLDFRGIWSFIFNFADVWINIGVILIIVEHIFFSRKKRVK